MRSLALLAAVILVAADRWDMKDRTENWQPIRIHVHFDASVDELSEKKMQMLKGSTKMAVEYFEKTLLVRREKGRLALQRVCANSWTVPVDMPGGACQTGKCHSSDNPTPTKCAGIVVPESHLLPCIECRAGSGNSIHTDENDCTIKGNSNWKDASVYRSAIEGLDVDFILYVKATISPPGGSCGSWVARGGPCQEEPKWNRPIAGHVDFCDNGLAEDNIEYNRGVILHEMVHVFAFISSHFWTSPFWKPDGTPYTKRDENNHYANPHETVPPIHRVITRNDWMTRNGKVSHNVTVLTTPNLIRESREHFSCPTLEGLEIENFPESGTQFSHWEKRIVMNDVMTSGGPHVMSKRTLALLEDSGWYKISDYRNAPTVHWGRRLGCDFVKKSCGEWIQSRRAKNLFPTPWCDRVLGGYQGCSWDRTAIESCNLEKHMNGSVPVTVPREYQYFSSIKGVPDSEMQYYGGYQKDDYCPYLRHWPKACNDPTNAHQLMNITTFGQAYGNSSYCIDFARSWQMEGKDYDFGLGAELAGGCYRTACSNGALHIQFGETWHTCGPGDFHKHIHVSMTVDGKTASGVLVCPEAIEICGDDFGPDEARSTMWIGTLFILQLIGAALFGALFAAHHFIKR